MTSDALPSAILRGLLDTSVVISLEHLSPELLPRELLISAVTLAEIAAGPHAAVDEADRAVRQEQLQRVESLFEPLPFDAEAARAYGRVYAATGAQGRKPRGARSIDLLIASIAIANGLPLFTRNPSDFDHLRSIGLELHAV